MLTTPCGADQTQKDENSPDTAMAHSDGCYIRTCMTFRQATYLLRKGGSGKFSHTTITVAPCKMIMNHETQHCLGRQKRTVCSCHSRVLTGVAKSHPKTRYNTLGNLLDKSTNDMVADFGCITSSRRSPLGRIHQPHKPARFAHTRE